jgi:hypothetical protein
VVLLRDRTIWGRLNGRRQLRESEKREVVGRRFEYQALREVTAISIFEAN